MTAEEKNTHLANERQHVAGDVPLREARCGVDEEIVPFPREGVVLCAVPQRREVLHELLLRDVRVEATPPFAQYARVI